MENIIGQASEAPTDLIKNSSDASFMADVVEASRQVPVLVDFWAPWCGPCKQLGPILEKVVAQAGGTVKLVKINVDENPGIAGQLQVRSIPAVFAFKGGQPVDAFMGALPESQIKQFIEKLSGGAIGPSPVEQAMEIAAAALEAGDLQTAGGAYSQVLQAEPANPDAIAGLSRVFIQMGDLDKASQILEQTPAEHAEHTAIAGAKAALKLAETAANAPDTAPLRLAVEADPDDHASRFELAKALIAGGQHADGAYELLEIIRRDRGWNDEAARKELLTLFDALGPADPLTLELRRRLSSILFS